MTFAWPAALWGLCAVPVLVALYLLRVRRREHPVSSILLWERSAPTLAAHRPTRRIERYLLLFLQVLAVTAIVAGLAEPAVVGWGAGARDLVLVLDGSLSMQARDVAPTRFARARGEALAMVRGLRIGQRAAVVLATPRPIVLSPLTADRARLRAALRSARPWDAAADVPGAVALAESLAPGGARVEVWTDAARGPLSARPRVTYHVIGASDDNVGITVLRVLRGPAAAEALVRVWNFSDRPRRVPLEIRRSGALVYRSALALAGRAGRTVVVPLGAAAGIVEARLVVQDALPEDDRAVAVLDAAPLPSVLLVSRGNPYLEQVLRALPVARASETSTLDPSTWGAFDVVILDRMSPESLSPGSYLLIGAVPSDLPVSAGGEVTRPEIAAWDRTDPVLRFVDLADVHVDHALALDPRGGRVLVEGRTPLLWAYQGRGVRALLLAFPLSDSDLPMHTAFPILMANSLAWLGGHVAEVRAGMAPQIPAGGSAAGTLVMPDGRRIGVSATDGVFVLPALTRAGIYRLVSAAGSRMFAVGIDDPLAGSIRPGRAPSGAAPSQDAVAEAPPEARLVRALLSPWCLAAAVLAVIGEWVLATRRRGGEV